MRSQNCAFVICFALFLGGGCGKQSPPGETAVQRPVLEQTAAPTASAVQPSLPAITNSVARETNRTEVARSYPAQDLYEQAMNLVRTNQSKSAGEEALILFRNAAEKGNTPAQHALGLSYLGGIGVEKDPDKGIKMLTQSAEAGYSEAQFKLASIYAIGGPVPKDEAKAAELARKAAEQGHTEAEYNLGTLYQVGKGVPKDEKQAALWFKKAAEGGHPAAQSNLGVLYANGEVLDKNLPEAVKWWQKAAEQGQPSAQFNLAQALTEGKALPKDLVEAYKWYHLAAEMGDQESARLRDAVGTELQPSEVADALKRARLFRTQLIAKWESARQKLSTN